MPRHNDPNISTAMVRYIRNYMILGKPAKPGPITRDDTERKLAFRNWHIADRDIQRDWGW